MELMILCGNWFSVNSNRVRLTFDLKSNPKKKLWARRSWMKVWVRLTQGNAWYCTIWFSVYRNSELDLWPSDETSAWVIVQKRNPDRCSAQKYSLSPGLIFHACKVLLYWRLDFELINVFLMISFYFHFQLCYLDLSLNIR